MDNIYISGLEGKTKTLPIQSSKMNSYKVSELRALIRDRMGVSIEHQRLLYGTKELEDTQTAGSAMTFQDYGIMGGATIVLVARLPAQAPKELSALKLLTRFHNLGLSITYKYQRSVGHTNINSIKNGKMYLEFERKNFSAIISSAVPTWS